VHPISQAKQDLDNLMINLIKYELARKNAKIQPLTTPECASRLRSPQILPGTVFRDIEATWCPELVMIPAGSFVMGSPGAGGGAPPG
jgi:hypothetical protein